MAECGYSATSWWPLVRPLRCQSGCHLRQPTPAFRVSSVSTCGKVSFVSMKHVVSRLGARELRSTARNARTGTAAFCTTQFQIRVRIISRQWDPTEPLTRVRPLAATRSLSVELNSDLSTWVVQSKTANEGRTALLHGQWRLGSDGVAQIRGRNKGLEKRQAVALDEIRAAALALQTAYQQGLSLWVRLMEEQDHPVGLERTLFTFDSPQPEDSIGGED